jgi:hypothetical protein
MNAVTNFTIPTGSALVRAVTAALVDHVQPDGAQRFFQRHPDEEARAVFKATTGIGSTETPGWGSELGQTAVADFIASLGPIAGAAQLFAGALNIPLGRFHSASVPGATAAALAGAFVEEGEPIPVAGWTFTGEEISFKKCAILSAISRQLARSSRAEDEVRRLLRENAALTLDAYLFSSNAATDAAPAGIFNGLTAITPGSFDSSSVINDLASLVAAVAPVGGNNLALVASPARKAQILMHFPGFAFPIIASSAIADTRIGAVALNGLAVAIDPAPELDISSDAVVHMANPALEIVSDTPVVADPIRSLWQTDALAIRLQLGVDWKRRATNAVAMLDGPAW